MARHPLGNDSFWPSPERIAAFNKSKKKIKKAITRSLREEAERQGQRTQAEIDAIEGRRSDITSGGAIARHNQISGNRVPFGENAGRRESNPYVRPSDFVFARKYQTTPDSQEVKVPKGNEKLKRKIDI